MIADLTPQEAWQPLQPAQGQWTERLVAHLYRRAGFGATASEIAAGVQASPEELVESLISGRTESAEKRAEFDSLSESAIPTNNADTLSAAWLYRCLYTTDVLKEKMTLFWHGHFATSNEKVQNTKLMLQQNRLLRADATGDFRNLAHGIAKDPAMLIYLDSESNRKAHPNENFARELMELFVLGEGNYMETDVRELSRCFTGWELRRGRYRFNRYQHDRGEKTVLGTTGKLTGEQGVDIVLDHAAGPRFIVGKLVRFFVCDEPALSPEYIEPLAAELREANWQIAPVLRTIFRSRLFYSSAAIGRKIRSPVDLAVGMLRSLEGTCNTSQLGVELRRLGQGLYHPPNVKGWDGGRTWVNSSTLLGRANLVRRVLGDEKTRFAGASLDGLLSKHRAGSGSQAIAWLETMLLAAPLSDATRRELHDLLRTAEGSPDQRLRKAVHAISVQPEFQLC